MRGWGGGNVWRSLVGSQFGKVLGGDEVVPTWAGPGGGGGAIRGGLFLLVKVRVPTNTL